MPPRGRDTLGLHVLGGSLMAGRDIAHAYAKGHCRFGCVLESLHAKGADRDDHRSIGA